jgi:hypothetical protein
VYYEVLVVLYGQPNSNDDTLTHDLALQVVEETSSTVVSTPNKNKHQQQQNHQHEISFLNRYGNNRIIGDIGHYAQLPVRYL